MYYKKDLFREVGLDPEAPPATWDELLEAAKTLTGEQTYGLNPPPQWVHWAMTNQVGGGWVDPADNAVQIDEPGSVKAYGFAASWVREHEVASLDAALDSDVADQLFLGGRVGIDFNSTGDLTGYLEAAPFELGVAPLPCDEVCAAPIGGATLGILSSASEEEQRGAWEFIRFVTTPQNNALIFARTGYLPIIEGAIDEPAAQEVIEKSAGYLVANDQLDIAFARARPPAMPAIRSEEPAVWEAIVLGEKAAEEALSEFADEMRGMMATN